MSCGLRTVVDQNHEPRDGLFCNVIVHDPIKQATWIYDSHGIYSEGTRGYRGYSIRATSIDFSEGAVVNLSDIDNSNDIQVGDLLMNNRGEFYEVTKLNETSVQVGNLVTSLVNASGIPDAPDNKFYARTKDEWVEISTAEI